MDSKKAKKNQTCLIKSDHELLITKKTKNSKMSDKIYSDENQSDLKNEKFDKNRKKKISKSYWQQDYFSNIETYGKIKMYANNTYKKHGTRAPEAQRKGWAQKNLLW